MIKRRQVAEVQEPTYSGPEAGNTAMSVPTRPQNELADRLLNRIVSGTAIIGIMGLGYVGLPLAISFARAGFRTVGFELDNSRLDELARGHSYVDNLPSDEVQSHVSQGRLSATSDMRGLAELDALVICLPTPLGRAGEPDLSILTGALGTIGEFLRPGQLILLSSTTYPGTTEELALPRLQCSGLRVGEDFFLAYSPERVDPGNQRFSPNEIPRVVAGITPQCAALATALLRTIVDEVHAVANCRTAEMTKLLENTFRSVNIALVNEMAVICQKLDVDVWEVIDAASTKPYGYMRFEPGPGLGGHCIPIDPAYLAWRLRTLKYRARFVELAEDINRMMPEYFANLVTQSLDKAGVPIRGARILALGVAYKRNVSDARESPAVEVVTILRSRGALLTVHDPLVRGRVLPDLPILNGVVSDQLLREQDCVLILTDHSAYDWRRVVSLARLIVDSRGVTRALGIGNVVRI